ncbi:MAG: SAM-dependent methyltransferase [Mangrovibacterium sp.]
MASLYLIPITLGETALETVLPSNNSKITGQLKHFIVENVRTARRFLKQVDKDINIDELTFYELNKHTDLKAIGEYLQPLKDGFSVGIMSEAGCPGIADPGAEVVRLAHQKDIHIVPLVGPSSILLAMMASGMNGQNFAFNGYLPIKKNEKQKHLKMLEGRIFKENQSQVFIEAPYRNLQLLEDLLACCAPNTKLCIACNITCNDEYIKTKTIAQWKKAQPDIQKKPTIFILGS